ncbi:MAG: PD40 domain-containing protein [Gemmatimonadetes bacterium]|nr:PD40 domain-containing protein [Gemmatimonadota bacterium]
MSRTHHPRRRAYALATAAVALAAGCREAPAPFDTPDRFADREQTLRRITYSVRDDRAPTWRGKDSVYYSAGELDPLARTRGLLAALPRAGGTISPVLPQIQQPGSTVWFTAPAVAPGGDRIAYVEVSFLWHPRLCLGLLFCSSGDSISPLPPLGEVIVRVRRFGEDRPIEQDPELGLKFAGRFFDESQSMFGAQGVFIVRFHPFQRLFEDEKALLFRPSWAPDGRRVVTSDGLRLLVWTLDQPQPMVIPGTEDGIWPAWSPDGAWIAFTRLERADSMTSICRYQGDLAVLCVERRTVYSVGRRMLTLVRPDGRDRKELGPGEEPAWAPDGRTLYFRRGQAIWKSDADGAAAAPIPETEGGREPAVSPDGRYLAFARRVAPGNHDVWVLALSPGSR